MTISSLEARLSGGHPNSLGNTVAIVAEILAGKTKLRQLYDCYQSDDPLVRLRVSNAMKRICQQKPEWVAHYLDGLLQDIATIDQASTKWTLATLFMWLDGYMSNAQRTQAIATMQRNLRHETDWIVLNTTAESLAYFASRDKALQRWLVPELQSLTSNPHKSVAKRAEKLLIRLS